MENTPVDEFGSRRSTVYGPNGAVATSQPLAAEAGLETLRTGGNAFDAAVATAATLNVTEPTMTGLGGDVFMLYRDADGEVGAMRACGGAPSDATREQVRSAIADEQGLGRDTVAMPETGPHTVTVPGTARGWEATVDEFGRLSLAEVLEPAIEYAMEGYPVTEVIADQWTQAETLFESDHARAAYLVDGERAPEPGETVRLQRLGESLRAIAEEGADVVYEGYIAEAIAEEIQRAGGFLTVEDLADFEVEYPDPVSVEYGDATVYELPPNNQGLIALEALAIAEEIGVDEYEAGSAARIHYLAEAMKRAFHDGHRYITDPDFEEIPPLASEKWAQKRAATVDGTASDVSFGVPEANAEDADTVLLCVGDSEGNVVSYINSRFAGFGSGLVAGETGIALQNRGASFSLNPDHPNRIEPGKRPFHTLIPAILERGPEDCSAFGVMGGYMQPQGHLQTLVRLLDDGATLQEALDVPRWRYRESGRLAIEARHSTAVQHGLLRRGHELEVLPPGMFGGAQIVRNREGTLSGATEPRKDGTVTTF
ncbi:gamma-glutamyltransferase [Natronomonas sp. F2-12]|jgi:gamma-glutamyltranspeptidase/glutathione hydrolase|uniref:Gamma-glutamyltransferase n=1 Tax=Natronomonas aquatica TaxID=2841590 RepID=A0A9R1CQF9_9EURY|nr:gamma-glutamyltransferase [Natronomonas aquatica]MCQ4331977.1 gamma-glutamyltransferase [Natronomonas aquatica]